MTFRDIKLKENQEYFVHYDKVWETIIQYNWSHCIEDFVKGAQIDTLICILNLYEEYMNLRPAVMEQDFYEGKLTIDAFRIGKLASYDSSTIKKHIKKIQELEILTIKLPLSEYYQGYYDIYLNPSYILTAEPKGLILNTKN
ncbi:hypothetical protein [uncultured Aquimarina sp.]|uniref:hypothetical protein n=1 Tax=uncultured Aquimarina sp. TaxID=575652 RepID=UPI0026029DCF|nr:hypothetical protein [uncultured Aquimarina sp.]